MINNYVTSFRGDLGDKLFIKDEPMTPPAEFGESNFYFNNDFENYRHIRRSLSSNNIADLKHMKKEVQQSKLDMFPRHRRPTGSTQDLAKAKFVSMAEAMYHFQRDTPGRFHSTGPKIFQSQGFIRPKELTMPQSPMLRCKDRSRPVNHMTQEERERKELEEIQKFKIKANPIPKSVLEGSYLPEVPRKSVTIPEPFKLTEIHKKPTQQLDDKVQSFKARPAPKHILENPQVPIKKPAHTTKPCSPKFHYQKPVTVVPKQVTPALQTEKPAQRHGPVKPEPFSFEKRDEHLKKLKEEKIKRQIEEERKQAAQFKARPLPESIKKRMQSVSSKGGSSTTSENKENNHVKFEAKPALVLHKEPFKPVLQPSQVAQPTPFQLTTEKRAIERENFDRLLKEKEKEMEKLRLKKEYEKQKAEEQARAELRAKQVHHAKPAPAFQQFVPEKSVVPLTVPETPTFVRRRKN